MEQEKARQIVQSLPSLYPLKDFEEEAILALITPKDLNYKDIRGGEDRDYFCPNCNYELADGNFCCRCGQPLLDDY